MIAEEPKKAADAAFLLISRLDLTNSVALLVGTVGLTGSDDIGLIDYDIHNCCHYKGSNHIKHGMLLDKYR